MVSSLFRPLPLHSSVHTPKLKPYLRHLITIKCSATTLLLHNNIIIVSNGPQDALATTGPMMLRAQARTFTPRQGVREEGTFLPSAGELRVEHGVEACQSGLRQRCPEEEDAAEPPAAATGQAGDPLLPGAAAVATVPKTLATTRRDRPPVRWRPDWRRQGVDATRCWRRSR